MKFKKILVFLFIFSIFYFNLTRADAKIRISDSISTDNIEYGNYELDNTSLKEKLLKYVENNSDLENLRTIEDGILQQENEQEYVLIEDKYNVINFQFAQKKNSPAFRWSLPILSIYDSGDEIEGLNLNKELKNFSSEEAKSIVLNSLRDLGLDTVYNFQFMTFGIDNSDKTILSDQLTSMKEPTSLRHLSEFKPFYIVKAIPFMDGHQLNERLMGSVEKGSVIQGSSLYFTVNEEGVISCQLYGLYLPKTDNQSPKNIKIDDIISFMDHKFSNIITQGEIELKSIELKYCVPIFSSDNPSLTEIIPIVVVQLEETANDKKIIHPPVIIDPLSMTEVVLR